MHIKSPPLANAEALLLVCLSVRDVRLSVTRNAYRKHGFLKTKQFELWSLLTTNNYMGKNPFLDS